MNRRDSRFELRPIDALARSCGTGHGRLLRTAVALHQPRVGFVARELRALLEQ